MQTLATLAERHYRGQAQRAAKTAKVAQAAWQQIPLDDLWRAWDGGEALRLADTVARAQRGAAAASADYLGLVSAAQGVDVTNVINPSAFMSPANELPHWLGTAPARVTYDLRRGVPGTIAKQRGLAVLNRMVGTLVQDAGREATGAGIMITPGLNGYYRKLRTPSCSRCAILAGEYYRMEEAFKRHPACDCQHVPVAEVDAYDPEMDPVEMLRRGEVTGISEVARRAILEDGADMYRVVNAQRWGMRTTSMFGKRVTPHMLYKRVGGDYEAFLYEMFKRGFFRVT